MKTAFGLQNQPSCRVATLTGRTVARRYCASNRRRRRTSKLCSRPGAPFLHRSAANSYSPPDLWAAIRLGTAASLNADSSSWGVNSCGHPEVIVIIQIHSIPTGSLPLRLIRETCHAASLQTSSRIQVSHAKHSTSTDLAWPPLRNDRRRWLHLWEGQSFLMVAPIKRSGVLLLYIDTQPQPSVLRRSICVA